jgi:hypothetical protein
MSRNGSMTFRDGLKSSVDITLAPVRLSSRRSLAPQFWGELALVFGFLPPESTVYTQVLKLALSKVFAMLRSINPLLGGVGVG